MKYNYSIIIPHKDSPALLARCLSSIPKREDIQVIIIDDNSSPEKVDFQNFPGLNTKNTICVFDKSGKGAGHARNIGLGKAEGKWLIFSDCDDFFTADFTSILDENISSEYDLTYYDIESVYSDTLEPCNRSDNYKDKFYKAIEEGDMDLLRYKMTTPWGKIILHSLVRDNEIRFDETPVSNDACFSFFIGHNATNVNAVKKSLYVVTENRGSLMHQNSEKNLWCRLEVAAKINDYLILYKKPQYHINLFAYEYYFIHTGIGNIIKSFTYSVMHTPGKYVVADLWKCFVTGVIPSKRKLG